MAQMQAVYYRAADGSQPVDQFIEDLNDPAKQAALDNQIERLNLLRPKIRLCLSRGVPKSRGNSASCGVITDPRCTE